MAEIWTAEIAVDERLARSLVESQFPELAPARVELVGAGWDNTVYRVEGPSGAALIFRFPRRAVAVPLLRTEVRLLPAVASLLPLPVPVPACVGEPVESYPWPFAGYPLISGRTVASAGLAPGQRGAIARPLARFLSALHALPADLGREAGMGPDTIGRLDVPRRRERTSARLRALADSGLIADVRPFEDELDAAPVLPAPRSDVIVHGDLHAGQILVDDAGSLSGVIDWGDTHLGDPAVDLAAAHALLPPDAHDEFLAAYGPVDAVAWRAARARAVWHTVALMAHAADVGDGCMLLEARTALGFMVGAAAPGGPRPAGS